MASHGNILHERPLILAIENSGPCGSVALGSPNGCLAEYSLTSQKTHSKRLLATIDQLFRETEQTIFGIDAIAISIGPGSFTGLRIGLATVKGLCMAAAKPLIGVSTLDALAMQLPYQPRQVCAALDARKKEIFAACYKTDHHGLPRQTMAPAALSPEALAGLITEETVFIGDGIQLYGVLLAKKLGPLFKEVSPTLFFPRAGAIAAVALHLYAEGEFLDPLTAAPLYVRASDAEIQFGG
ncbi:MAG: tRNA (adenosine(37)-N6)-threonylcarbamoyltransferase complex dimerization subunit type 1 TsaB [Deltaproteobacteria bacterium]